jgi:peptidoglycan/LPS O-acetylase OafA/YrhL
VNEVAAPAPEDPPAADPRPQARFPLIDAMRGIAALSVLAYHVSDKFGYPRSGLLDYLFQRITGPQVVAVIVFFLISGFVLYRPFVEARYEGRSMPALVPYAVRRVARIVPAYWVALAIVTALLSLHYVLNPGAIIRYFGFMQVYATWSTAGGGIAPAWTLCVEVTFYALLPLLAIAIRRLGRGRSFLVSELGWCAAMTAVSVLWQVIIFAALSPSSDWRTSALSWLPSTLSLFAAGMALAAVSVWVEHSAHKPRPVQLVARAPWLCWLLAGGVFYGIGQMASLASHDYESWFILAQLLKTLAAALLLMPLIFGTSNQGWMRRLLGTRPFIFLGAISYGVYLWHQPLLDKLGPHLLRHGELFTLAALTAVTAAVATLSYYCVERPAQTLARRWLARRRAVRDPDPAPAILDRPLA